MSKKEREVLIKNLIRDPIPLYGRGFPLIFFWSPKSGCTSLVKWFLFQNGLLQKAIDYDPWVHKYRAEVFQKQNNYTTELTDQLLNDKNVTYKLVRNPYKRAVSSYLSTVTNENLKNKVFPGINNGFSFKQFLFKVKDIGVSSELIDRHIALQYVEGEECIIKNYLHLENFNNEIRMIENKYNLLASPIQNISKSPHHMAQNMTDKGKGSFAEVKLTLETAVGSLPTYESFYDGETIDLVKELFKKDFISFGYNPTNLK
ncbi:MULTISPECIES: sulfotransferase family 2 domain-containing protein [Metabacillus]|nr:sulfotransferase family 2 domain-containing protein [Metabacillus litoralis]